MRSTKLLNSLKVYVPVLKVKLSVDFEELNELGTFSRFILFSCGQKASLQDILNVTQLHDIVIHDELRYLSKIGLISSNEKHTTYSLTTHGETLYSMMLHAEAFNEQNETALINCVTGNIEPYAEDAILTKTEVPAGSSILQEKIIRELYRNQNPYNSKEFVLEQYDFNEMVNGLNVELHNEHVTCYLEKFISFLPSDTKTAPFYQVTEHERVHLKEDFSPPLVIERELWAVNPMVTRDNLITYRPVLSTLKKMKEYDQSLLSNKSIMLLEQEIEENHINTNLVRFFYDPHTGQAYHENVVYPLESSGKWTDIVLHATNEIMNVNAVSSFIQHLNLECSNKDYSMHYAIEQKVKVKQRISALSLFISEEESSL